MTHAPKITIGLLLTLWKHTSHGSLERTISLHNLVYISRITVLQMVRVNGLLYRLPLHLWSHEIRWVDRHVLKLKIVAPLELHCYPRIPNTNIILSLSFQIFVFSTLWSGSMNLASMTLFGIPRKRYSFYMGLWHDMSRILLLCKKSYKLMKWEWLKWIMEA